MKGFQDMAAYWKLPCEDFLKIAFDYTDVAHYIKQWDSAEYAKAILYGQIAISAIGCEYDNLYCSFHLPFDDKLNPNERGMVIPFLYAVRKPSVGDEAGCDLRFPPRYHKEGCITSGKDIVNAVRNWFKWGFPKIMFQVCCHGEDADGEYDDLLDDIALIATHSQGFQHPTARFVEQVVQRSSCLEVIILDSWFCIEEEKIALNEFLKFLSTQVGFFSRFRLLVITDFEEYTLLGENLNKLITAYFSAPTTHLQKIKITGAKVKSYENDFYPPIDQRYAQFKVIELEGCSFVSKQKFSQRAITQWLGQDISMLDVEKEKKVDSCIFKIKEQSTPRLLSRKRKHSE